MQRTFAACVEHAVQFRGESRFSTYLLAIANSQLHRWLRKRDPVREGLRPGESSVRGPRHLAQWGRRGAPGSDAGARGAPASAPRSPDRARAALLGRSGQCRDRRGRRGTAGHGALAAAPGAWRCSAIACSTLARRRRARWRSRCDAPVCAHRLPAQRRQPRGQPAAGASQAAAVSTQAGGHESGAASTRSAPRQGRHGAGSTRPTTHCSSEASAIKVLAAATESALDPSPASRRPSPRRAVPPQHRARVRDRTRRRAALRRDGAGRRGRRSTRGHGTARPGSRPGSMQSCRRPQGLAAAHAVGIVHCDVKPGNILVGRDGRVRVADFGLASLPHGHSTATTLSSDPSAQRSLTGIGGTPGYIAPERLAGHGPDAAGDQFALCVTAFRDPVGRPAGAWTRPRSRARRSGANRLAWRGVLLARAAWRSA